MKNLNMNGVREMSIEEQKVMYGGRIDDRKTIGDIIREIIKNGGSPGPYNPYPPTSSTNEL